MLTGAAENPVSLEGKAARECQDKRKQKKTKTTTNSDDRSTMLDALYDPSSSKRKNRKLIVVATEKR